MIDDQAIKKFLDELEKTGNVWSSCMKHNIHPSTVYRWREKDKEFRRAMKKAIRVGLDNMNDFSEHALMRNIKTGNQRAIEYHLGHKHPAYKSKTRVSKVIFSYDKKLPPPERAVTVEELEAIANGEYVLDENATKEPDHQNKTRRERTN